MKSPAKTIHHKTPRVAILLESSHEISRGMIRGVLKYVRLYGKWGVDIVSGGAGDQRLPDTRFWKGSGIIGRIPNRQVAAEVVAAKLPTVVIDPIDEFLHPSHPLSQQHSVRCDSNAIGRMAAEYFLDNHFECFAFVGEINGIIWSRQRQEAFLARLAEEGFSCQVYLPLTQQGQEWNIECKSMARWLKKFRKPVALFAANDQRARQVLDACQFAELSVPHQVAVLGVNNDLLICETTSPPLSSIALDSEGAGFAAAKMLDLIMRGGCPAVHDLAFGPTELVVRDSTGTVRVSNKSVMLALEFIRINSGTKIRVSDVANMMGVTRQWAERSFKRELRHSIMEEIKTVRMRTIRSLVAQTEIPFQEIASECGFETANHLGIIFKKQFGVTMSEYRAASRKETTETKDVSVHGP